MSYKPTTTAEEEEVDYDDIVSEASEQDEVRDEMEEEDDDEIDEDEDENKMIEAIVANDDEDDMKDKARRVGIQMDVDSDDDDSDEEDFEKFDKDIKESLIESYHPELKTLNYEEIEGLCVVVRDNHDIIIDPLHKTIPILSRYEKARILGERADQLNSGAEPFIDVDHTMIDGYLIAMKELEEKKIPFIVQRPLPNGGCEYWRLKDLEIL
jgi:DNA-directed RNA polymerases I, II, and III subunit RPABC2